MIYCSYSRWEGSGIPVFAAGVEGSGVTVLIVGGK